MVNDYPFLLTVNHRINAASQRPMPVSSATVLFQVVENAVASSVAQFCVALLIVAYKALQSISSLLQSTYVSPAQHHFGFLAAFAAMRTKHDSQSMLSKSIWFSSRIAVLLF
jgi:hypothetical protein